MNNILILSVSILILIILFFFIILLIGKSKIKEIIVPLDISKQEINELLKQKYKVYRDMIKFIKENLSIKEEAFQDFLNFDSKECLQSDLINILDITTKELNNYVNKYDEITKNIEFINLKKRCFNIQVNLEAIIDYYNSKVISYNNLKTNGPTSFSTKFFEFDEYNNIDNDKKEISSLINLN